MIPNYVLRIVAIRIVTDLKEIADSFKISLGMSSINCQEKWT